jgi:hypothetical protein
MSFIEPHKANSDAHSSGTFLCNTCGSVSKGSICFNCGEKKFSPQQLSLKSFLTQSIDVFTHFENKVIRSAWLNIRKPGLITYKNLAGIRVPYAKPLQLFIIINIVFFLFFTYVPRTDYVPSVSDERSSQISERPLMKWAAPLDNLLAKWIRDLRTNKLDSWQTSKENNRRYLKYSAFYEGPGLIGNTRALNNYAFLQEYDQKVKVFAKSLLFLLIPVIGLLFYTAFSKKIKFYGAAMILSTHFMVFNLSFYLIVQAISLLLQIWLPSSSLTHLIFGTLLYNDYLKGFSEIFFGLYNGFEALHIVGWMLWLFFAFKRLFCISWLYNIVLSYLLSRIIFLMIFCIFKKLIIGLTIWSL